MLLYFKYY